MASSEDFKWSKLTNPPPPLFLGEKERDLVKQINDELIKDVIGQQILYFPIDLERSNFHPLYGESLSKTFFPPIQIYVLVVWEGEETITEDGLIDRLSSIIIHFHKRALVEEQNLFVQEGDFVKYGNKFYEIITLSEPKEMFGQTNYKVEISAKCIQNREGVFDAK